MASFLRVSYFKFCFVCAAGFKYCSSVWPERETYLRGERERKDAGFRPARDDAQGFVQSRPGKHERHSHKKYRVREARRVSKHYQKNRIQAGRVSTFLCVFQRIFN